MGIILGGNTLSAGNFNTSGETVNNATAITKDIVLWLDAGNQSSYPLVSNYYDCGYGCQYYSSDPGCTNCNAQWKDMSGNGNDGTLTNGAAISYTNTGGSMYFDGINDYVNIKHHTTIAPATGYITVNAWFYATAAGTKNGSIIYNKENEYELSAGGGYITYAFRPNWAWVGDTAFSTNTWYCTTLTYDQSYQRLYVNGAEVYSAALSGAIGASYSNDLRIGARGAPDAASSFFNGYIPIVQVFNRALSATEVLENFNNQRLRFGI
jgi:hypothetical protein